MTGIVIQTKGLLSTVLTENNFIYSCLIKGSLRLKDFKYTNPVTVGDKVDISVTDNVEKTGVIVNLHKRTNSIARKSISSAMHANIIAANIEQLLILVTIKSPTVSLGFIDRFIISAEANNIESIIVINKLDSHYTAETQESTALESIYSNIGYKVIKISAKLNINIDILKKALYGKISLLAGKSGAGKSSTINAIRPSLSLKTADVSQYSNKGKHTTTFTEMYTIPNLQAYVIDSPGIKELGLVDIPKEYIKNCFVEFLELQKLCKFNNCMHVNEPNCAIIKATKEGIIASSRYKNYLSMLN